MSAPKCGVCGKPVETVKPCGYNRRFGPTCDECCEKCYNSEAFPCSDHEARRNPAAPRHSGYRTPGAAEQIFYIIKWTWQNRARKIKRLRRK